MWSVCSLQVESSQTYGIVRNRACTHHWVMIMVFGAGFSLSSLLFHLSSSPLVFERGKRMKNKRKEDQEK
jgi:hypothetical protein